MPPRKEKVIELKPTGFVEPERKEEVILPEHFHETDKIDFRFIRERKLYIHHTIYGLDAATNTNYGVFWIAPFNCTVTGVTEVHQTLGTDGSAVTLQIEKLTGTEALDAGVATLTSTGFDLKATINTIQTGTLTATLADRRLVKDDRLAMDDNGTLTAVANVTIIVEITF